MKVLEENVLKSLAKLTTHNAIENKVNSTVDEHNYVPNIAQRHVNIHKNITVDATEEGEHALRQLGYDKT